MARTSRNVNALIRDLKQAAAGAGTYAATVPLLQNTEAAILATVELLLGRPAGPGNNPPALKGVTTQWWEARAAKLEAGAHYRAALQDGRELALTCVSTLKTGLGRKWNSRWQAVGCANGSLRVPRKAGGMLRALAGYYAANPSREVRGVNGVDCTAAACDAAVQAIDNARIARNVANGTAAGAKRAYLAGLKAARQRMIGLRAELSMLLKPNDSRWYSYGLEKPAYRATPARPEDLTAHAAGSGAVRYEWTDSPRADNYRFTLKDTAGQILVEKLVNENSITISHIPSPLGGEGQGEGKLLPAGLTVTGEVSARNKTGESRPTAPVSVTVG